MPVMLLQNLWQRAGLVNGAMGKVKKVVWNEDAAIRHPAFVVIEFNGYRGPAFEGWPKHWRPDVDRRKWVPIPASSVYTCIHTSPCISSSDARPFVSDVYVL